MANESPDSGTPAAAPDMLATTDQPAPPAPVTVEAFETDTEAPGGRCPWCSAGLALGAGLASCASCGAHLSGGDDAVMPGLTQVVPGVLKKTVSAEPVRRSRLLAWISGEVLDEQPTLNAPAEALALPSRDVRREMLRLELEAAGITIPAELLAEAAPDAAAVALDAAAAPHDSHSTAA